MALVRSIRLNGGAVTFAHELGAVRRSGGLWKLKTAAGEWVSAWRVIANIPPAALDRLIGYGPPDHPTETLLRLHEREISTNRAGPRDHHYCHKSQGKWGAGDEEPYLGQLWPAE